MDSNLTIIWLCNSMCTDFRRCGEIDEEMKQKLNEMHVGRLIHILSHTMKRHNPAEVMENDDLTTMQKHVLKFILLETMHRDLYQKDIEEEFQIRKPTVTGILKLMEKNGYIYRESAKQDARLKQIIPTEKAEKIRPAILKSIEEGEAKCSGEFRRRMWNCANRFSGRCMKTGKNPAIAGMIFNRNNET